jgi:predicted nucleic acid-binding protein
LILLDTSGLLAAWDASEPRHAAALAALRRSEPPRVLSPFVLAELDYLVARKIGRAAQSELLSEVSGGAYSLASLVADDVSDARELIMRYADLDIGLADASVVLLAHRHSVQEVLTLDERHFRVLPGPLGPFRILPADE